MPRTITPATMPELRRALTPIRGLQVRAGEETGDGSLVIRGHAAVFDEETVLLDWGWWRLREVIAPGAFSAVLARQPLVHLVHEHDNQTAIAATDVEGLGGLELEEDDEGLRFFARCDPEDFDVARLAPKMRLGVVKQASFAFTIAAHKSESTFDKDGNEDELVTITEIGELYDVSICAQGAYPQTDSQLAARNLSHYLGRAAPAGPNEEDVAPEEPAEGDPAGAEDPVAPEPVGGEPSDDRRRQLARLRARSRLAVATLTDRR